MQHTNTPRGQTQTENVVFKNKSHSRVSLSGIFNACRCKNKEKILNQVQDDFIIEQCVEDPRLQPSGMTSNFIPPHPAFGHPLPQGARETVHGFTLIELLVVVLIIGLLAAVALPQYNKAVKRAQGREVYAAIDSFNKTLTDYYLENGSYGKELQAGTYRGVTQDELNIQVPSLNHFWFVQPENDIHTSSFVSGTIQGHTDSGYQVDIASGQWNPGPIPASHFKIEIRWENGHLKSKSCHPADVCALYFDGTVQEVQLTSSVEKEFVW